MSRLFNLITALTIASACGPKPGDTDSATGETTGEPPGTSTADPETTDAPTTDAPTTGEPTTGAPLSCDPPPAPELGPDATIRLQNAGEAAIFVDLRLPCTPTFPFAIVDPAGEELNTHLGLCEFTCTDALIGECGCPAGCGDPGGVIQIAPGATYEVVWSGERWTDDLIAPECGADCDPSCVFREQAAPGKYKFVARASGLVAECEPCECVIGESGWCEVAGKRDGDERVVEGELDYPAQTELTLVFP